MAATAEISPRRWIRTVLNPPTLACLSIYIASFIYVGSQGGSVEEPLFGLLILGLGFSFLAWFATRKATPLVSGTEAIRHDLLLVGVSLVVVCVWLVAGRDLGANLLPAAWRNIGIVRDLANVVGKLIAFVLIPVWLFRSVGGATWSGLGFSLDSARALHGNHLAVVLIVSAAMLVFQYLLGSGAAPLRNGELSFAQVALGLPLCFLWLVVEVGLVEEFFFRALLQARLAVWLRSESAGIAVMALLFGLAHAPGYILRGAGEVESVGASPDTLFALSFLIINLSVSAVFLGIVWARTRNLLALMLIHAAVDLLPNVDEFVKTWGL